MKFRHIAAAVLLAATASAHALPALDTSDPINMPVFGVSFGSGSATTNFDISFSQASTLSGSLYALLPVTMNSISLTKIGGGYSALAVSPNSGTFSFAGISQGSYTLSFSFSPMLGAGAFSGTITATPVPEPESVALALAGLGVVGMLARRRRTAA